MFTSIAYFIVLLRLLIALKFPGITLVILVATSLTFFGSNQHIRISLIQLELFTITAILVAIIGGFRGYIRITFVMILFAVGVIEATLGLSLLATTSRSQRNELFKFSL